MTSREGDAVTVPSGPELSYPNYSVWSEPAPLFRRPGVLPEPYRRAPLPPRPDQHPAPTDLDELEHVLRQHAHGTGMTDDEIDAAEQGLGFRLPPELRLLHRVLGDGWWKGDYLGFALVGLDDEIHERPRWFWGAWSDLAQTAGRTEPDGQVQALCDPAEWIVFGTNDVWNLAIDLVPGPAGKVGQVIAWNDADGGPPFGAVVWAGSLLDLLRIEPGSSRNTEVRGTGAINRLPLYAEIDRFTGYSAADVAGPELEVVSIRPPAGETRSVAPLAGLPRLRTLVANNDAVSDVEGLKTLHALEYLELGVDQWQTLLDAGAVPPNLLAAGIAPGRGSTGTEIDIRYQLRELWELPRPAHG